MTADLTSLIEKLEAAEGPSRKLDALIGREFGYPDDAFPSFTRSLDARIPGEDIERSCRDSKGEWSAWDARGDFVGYGKTEPLARRIAALRAKLTEASHG